MTETCIGLLNPSLREKLNLPDSINEVHVCWLKDSCCQFRLRIKTVAEIENFMRQWMDKSNVVWRVNKTDPTGKSAGVRNVYWKEFRCQKGNTKVSKRTKNVHKKHTNCLAKMTATIKNVPRKCRSSDVHLPRYPTIIKINMAHNHEIDNYEYLKQKQVTKEVRQKFIRLFTRGYTPTSALKLHKTDLKTEVGERYAEVILDRAICPDLQWCYRLHATYAAEMLIDEESEDEKMDEYRNNNEISVSSDQEVENPPDENDASDLIEVIFDDEIVRTIKNELSEFTDFVCQRIEACDELLPALMKFNETWKNFTMDSQLISALNMFGKINANGIQSTSTVQPKQVKKVIRIKPER